MWRFGFLLCLLPLAASAETLNDFLQKSTCEQRGKGARIVMEARQKGHPKELLLDIYETAQFDEAIEEEYRKEILEAYAVEKYDTVEEAYAAIVAFGELVETRCLEKLAGSNE